MNAQRALRVVLIALLLGSLIVLASALLARRQNSIRSDSETRLDVPESQIAMPLDANGVGYQGIAGLQLTYRLSPYPPRAGQPAELTLIAFDPAAGAARAVTPTLEIAPEARVDGATFPFEPQPGGAYVAGGVFFPEPGVWRMRVPLRLFADENYTTVMLLRVE